jgi:hypothetical protein
MPCAICWCSLGHLPGCPDYRVVDNEDHDYQDDRSDCCDAPIIHHDICSACHEHCGTQEIEEC